MNEGTVRQWRRMFKDGRTNVHDEERNVRPSVVSDDLVRSFDQKLVKDDLSQIKNYHVNFPNFHALSYMSLSQLG
jgi:hypothetical protein